MRGRIAGKDFKTEYQVEAASSVVTGLVPRFWAGEYIRQLLGSGQSTDDHRSKVLELGIDYGLMTPYTSILALESEAAYARQNVKRRSSPLRGVRLTALENDEEERRLALSLNPASVPVSMAGCQKESPDEATAQPDFKDQAGTRAKGEQTPPGAPRAGRPGAAAAAPAPVASAAPTVGGFDSVNESAAPVDLATDSLADSSGYGNARGALGAAGGEGGGGRSEGAGLGSIGTMGHSAPSTPPPPAAAPRAPAGYAAGAKTAANRPDRDERVAAGTGARRSPQGDTERHKAVDAKNALDKQRAEPAKSATVTSTPPVSIARRPPTRCSDAASRPLPERIMLWERRLKGVTRGVELMQQYELARSGCELPDWRDQSALLDMMQKRIDTEESVEVVLSHFAGEREAQKFVARSVLRRTVDPRMAAAVSRVLFGGRIDWVEVDRELLDTPKPADKLDKLRRAMLVAPGDPSGEARLVRLLADSGQVSEALSHGRRLRDRGLMTPLLAQCLGDVLAQAGERDEALRTYSEIVEFDPANPASRRVLGDAFLRHGWYAAAYRQYRTLADLEAKNPLNWLRLASAAAGSGRIDEALRIEREVAADEGSPGPNDPRLWARLWSAARLGCCSTTRPRQAESRRSTSIVRKLKELQLFSGPGTLSLLTWEDLDANVVLVGKEAGKESLVGEMTDAAPTGLGALLLNKEAWDKRSWSVRWRSDARGRPVKFALVERDWDGRAFAVKIDRGEVKPDQQEAPL